MVLPELLEMAAEVGLSAGAVCFFRLGQPLVHGSLDQIAHVVAHHVAERLRVIQGLPAQRVPQKRVQVAVQGSGHELDVAALDGHHEWCDACVGHGVDIDCLVRDQLLEEVQIAGTASEVKDCAADAVTRIQVRLQR